MSRFLFGPSGVEHVRDDDSCPGCRWDVPRPCLCGGTVHIEFVDSRDRPFLYWCDRCSGSASPWRPVTIDLDHI